MNARDWHRRNAAEGLQLSLFAFGGEDAKIRELIGASLYPEERHNVLEAMEAVALCARGLSFAPVFMDGEPVEAGVIVVGLGLEELVYNRAAGLSGLN